MKKILCPTDFSQHAENGISFAAKLAKKIGASLHILHVHLLSDLTPEEALLGVRMDEELIKKKLDNECLEVSRVFKVCCYAEAAGIGMSLAKEISRVAEGFDLIVMGTNGEDGLSQDIFGSNTYQVIRKVNVPLLMIPEQCGYSEIDHIIFAYDYWRSDSRPVNKVINLAKQLGARLTVLQVMEAYSGDADVELRALQKMIKEMHTEVDIAFETIYEDDLGEGINQFAMRARADLLAMCFQPGKMQKMFYSGIVRRVTTETAYPLIVFH